MMITDTSKRVIPFRSGDAKRVGEGCMYLDQIVWLNGANIEMGDNVRFNFGCWVNGYGGLTIGNDVGVGPGTMIHTANHLSGDHDRATIDQGWESRPVTIGDNVWIGMGVRILPGVTIGDGAIIGAGSVVTKDLPPMSVNVGLPATTIKTRD